MKKRICYMLLVGVLLVNLFSLLACNSSIKKYEYTHINGETSKFEINFNNETWNYQGICIWQTIRLGADYGKGNVGMSEKCNGTMTLSNSYDSGDKFYTFKSTTADLNWQIEVYVYADHSKITCYISSGKYTFNLR